MSLPTTWVMGCAYAPSGQAVACGGLDNKLTVFPLSLEDDSSARKKVVGTHTSYTSCCLFPGSDNQVRERASLFRQQMVRKIAACSIQY